MRECHNGKMLPIEKMPSIRTYGDHANHLSVLSNSQYFSNWFYSNYMFITYEECLPDGHPLYFDHELIATCKLTDVFYFYLHDQPDLIKNMIPFLKEAIERGLYCIVPLNERYVPNTPSFQRRDFSHRNFFYGYSDTDKIFYTMTHDKSRRYMEAALSYEDFGQAMTSMAPAWPLITMKTNTCTYFMDWGKVACDFAEYTADRASTLENRPTLSGINVSLKLIEVLESIQIGNARKDARIFGTLKEHKNVLLKKAQFFIACGIPFEDEHLTAKYEELYKLADLCEKLFLKYEITGNAEIIGRMISLLRSIFTIEKDVIDTTKRGLIRYLEKIKWDKPVGFNDRQTSIHCVSEEEENALLFQPDPKTSSIGMLQTGQWCEYQRNLWEDGKLVYKFDLPSSAVDFTLYARVWGAVQVYVSEDSKHWNLTFSEQIAGPTPGIKVCSKYTPDGKTVYVKFATQNALGITGIIWCYSEA